MNRRNALKTMTVLSASVPGISAVMAAPAAPAAGNAPDADNFYRSASVVTETVRFKDIYGFERAGSLCLPKTLDRSAKNAAIAISHPHGAVRQQAALLYAQKLAETGFVTLAFDHYGWGESGGNPRGQICPDLYVEGYSAAVDYLGTLPYVGRERIGVLGICASGAFALAAAKMDARIRSVATVSMYDMGEYFRTGVRGDRPESRLREDLKRIGEFRWKQVDSGAPAYGPGQNDPGFVESVESNAYYRTPRGEYAPNDRRMTPASYVKFLSFFPFENIDLISPRPILMVVGDAAPSRHYTDQAFAAAAEPKERFVVEGANRTDLYDRVNMIPFAKLGDFFTKSLA
ncbi:alpha/beta hydrolase [Sutterella sp.]|uniref:alpha/beta hydrolase n=1 Tax=Sutterella sp. TaxID=1981025 RepID=UPI0026E03423|nr:alpha/beta hydrolase [Sutterella sp.]MDO5532539.1 alpha/beta hydrolase [Sutterella sp.]